MPSSSGKDDEDRPATRSDRGTSATTITWLGHSTVLLELDGTRLLTDPLLRSRVGPLVRIAPHGSPRVPRELDGVVLSHLHADHTHLPSLLDLDAAVPVIAPANAARWLGEHGVRSVTELRQGSELPLGRVRLTATEAVHDQRRRPLGARADSIGYVIAGSRSVYFAGDTDIFPAMAELRGAISLALLPVWGWGPNLGPGHLDPARAATATALISPAVVIPIHWGTFALGWPFRPPRDPDRPAREFSALVKRYAPSVEVRLLAPGETTHL